MLQKGLSTKHLEIQVSSGWVNVGWERVKTILSLWRPNMVPWVKEVGWFGWGVLLFSRWVIFLSTKWVAGFGGDPVSAPVGTSYQSRPSWQNYQTVSSKCRNGYLHPGHTVITNHKIIQENDLKSENSEKKYVNVQMNKVDCGQPSYKVCNLKKTTWVKWRSFITSSTMPLRRRAHRKSVSDRVRCAGPWSSLKVSASTSWIFPWISIWSPEKTE